MDPVAFQSFAAEQIAQRFVNYMSNPLMVDRITPVPFLQTLIAITGSGKTLMLAEVVERIAEALPLPPVVLWISKGRVVVSQTFENLSVGKYAENLPGFRVLPLLEVAAENLSSSEVPLLLLATVGKFAVEDGASEERKVYRAQLDLAEESLWDLLKKRRTERGLKRPLIIIYDEGHNLSNLQTERLLELSPDALIVASATMSLPQGLNGIINRLRNDRKWSDADFSTAVSSPEVVDAQLVKERISIDGYMTPMETALDNMLSDLAAAQTSATSLNLPYTPKAIYVCSTNTVDGMLTSEDIKRPLALRQARPILIWRHLVEVAKIDPDKIAVYCQLKFSKEYPKPQNMQLFDGAEKDYANFIEGDYEHIIFNLGLQEGWDDPAASFAYIDKEMASARQITQVIGRVLRQPGAKHYNDPILNTAHFHIRTDEKRVFDDILREIRADLISKHPSIAIVVRDEKSRGKKDSLDPDPSKTVPKVAIESSDALEPIKGIVEGMMDFREGGSNTVGQGSRMQVLQLIGEDTDASYEWVEAEHSNRVLARHVFRREIQRNYPGALQRTGGPINLVDIEDPKFDAPIEASSPAAEHIRSKARDVVQAYKQHSIIFQDDDSHPYVVGPIAVDPEGGEVFKRSLHERYSGLNNFELDFARALDKTQRVWARNPSAGGYHIPLLNEGKAYFPDFLVWVDKGIVAVDTKGTHLLTDAAASKLFEIDGPSTGRRIALRLISEGHQELSGGVLQTRRANGYTVWTWRNGRANGAFFDTVKAAAEAAIKLD
ncbi:DEAD/DEAH box helicase family protein [Paracoccus sp. 228]|uniref:DEAD/DEAH box helicase family protein n=1 Tax=Paracoccus sp. 228 TaxID=1192054 RepID=UPI0005E91166|nr:DEAD/DEAH box helicase family protein [Paracoccus sp. 228]KIX16227.1 hypothetical protein SY26_19120 [Paracoccus sp. 228]